MGRPRVYPLFPIAVSPARAVTATQLPERIIRQAVEDGALPMVEIEGRLRILVRDLEAWMASNYPAVRKWRGKA